MLAGWGTLGTQSNFLTIDLSEEEEEDWMTIKETTRWTQSLRQNRSFIGLTS